MSPLEIWCNEAQERYVLIVAAAQLAGFGALCERERCPFAVIGEVTDDGRLQVEDPLFGNAPVDMPLATLLGKTPRMTRDVRRLPHAADDFDPTGIDVRDAASGCCDCRPSPTRRSSSRSVTDPSAAWSAVIRSWDRGRSRSATWPSP